MPYLMSPQFIQARLLLLKSSSLVLTRRVEDWQRHGDGVAAHTRLHPPSLACTRTAPSLGALDGARAQTTLFLRRGFDIIARQVAHAWIDSFPRPVRDKASRLIMFVLHNMRYVVLLYLYYS